MECKNFLRAVGVLAAATAFGIITALPSNAETGTVLNTEEVSYLGEAGGIFGVSVSKTSCDVNGDGHRDSIVGDWRWDRPGYDMTGAGYVLLGGAEMPGGHVDEPNNSNTIRIDGPSAAISGGAWMGWSVSCLGDVNADGIDDFVLGAGSRGYHRVHVIFGSKDLSSIDVDFLGSGGFIIEDSGANDKTAGDKSADNFGFAVSSVGDINGDGLADIGVSDLLADNNGRTNSGRSWIVSGSGSAGTVNVADPADAGRVLMTVDGANANDRTANLVPLGDVNGDGLDDIATSAYTARVWGPEVGVPGAGYVIFGQRQAAGVDLADLGAAGFTVKGPQRGADRLGTSIAAAGDVNGDGLNDVVIGADGVSSGSAARHGGAAVVYGANSTADVLTNPEAAQASVYTVGDTPDAPAQTRGFWINGESDGSKLGYSVTSLSDVNGDGSGELVLGAQTGATWVVYGGPERAATLELSSATAMEAVKISDTLGASVGNAGDMDGNGTEDIIAGGANKASILLLDANLYALSLSVPDAAVYGAPFAASVTLGGDAIPAGEVQGTLDFAVNGNPVAGCFAVPITSQASCNVTIDQPGVEGAPASTAKAAAGDALIQVRFTPVEGSRLAGLTASKTVALAGPTQSTEGPAIPDTQNSGQPTFGTGSNQTSTSTATGTVLFGEDQQNGGSLATTGPAGVGALLLAAFAALGGGAILLRRRRIGRHG